MNLEKIRQMALEKANNATGVVVLAVIQAQIKTHHRHGFCGCDACLAHFAYVTRKLRLYKMNKKGCRYWSRHHDTARLELEQDTAKSRAWWQEKLTI